MSLDPKQEQQAAAQAADPNALGAFVLALREALLGLPSENAPETAEVHAQIGRLHALAKRLEAREADLEKARQQLIGPWQKLLEEALPKLKQRLDSGGLKDLFEFQNMLEEVRRRLATPPPAVLPEGLQAQEVTRLQAEVVRLLEDRRRREAEAPPLKARVAQLEAELQAAGEQLQRLAREAADARADRDQAARDAERAGKEAAEAQWQLAYKDATAQSLESRRFQEQFQVWRGKVEQLERELETARQAALAAAQEAGLARDDVGRAVHQLAQADDERKRLAESEAKAREAAGRLEAEAAAAHRDLEAARERETALKTETSALRERLAAARAEVDHEHRERLALGEAVRRLEEQLAATSRLRADLEPRLRQAEHDAVERGVQLEKTKARLSVLEETNAERTSELEVTARRLAEEAEAAKKIAERLDTVQRACHTLDAKARQAEESSALQLARLAAERERTAQALEQALARTGALEQQLAFSTAGERSSLDRAKQAEAQASQLESLRRRLEGELAQAREELSDQKADTERVKRELLQAREALAASEEAHRQSVSLTEALQAEVKGLQDQLSAAQHGLAEARREFREGAKREGLKAGSLHVVERELERLKTELAQREAIIANERRERAALEDELARDRARIAADSQRLLELAKAAEEREATIDAGETPPRASAPPSAPVFGVDGLDGALRTLLGTLESSLAVVRSAADVSAASRPVLQNVVAELNVLQDQIRSLTELYRIPLPPAPRAVAPVVEAVLKGWTPSLRARAIEIDYRAASGLPPCAVHPERLTVVFHQLLRNAHAAMPEGGKLRVEVGYADNDVLIRMTDSGPGFPEDVLAEPERPFRRNNPGHLGIGLALAGRFAKTIGGELKVANGPEGGAVVELRVPRHVPPEKRR